MKQLFASVLMVMAAGLAEAEIYKWVDAEGTVHYGDEPGTVGAKPVTDLPELTTYGARKPSKQTNAVSQPAESAATASDSSQQKALTRSATKPVDPKAKPLTAVVYKEISIVKPEQDETLRDNEGNITVFVALSPVLVKGDYIKVILDGVELEEQYHTTVLNIAGVERGEHQVAVAVYDAKGMQQLVSEAHRFFMHQAIQNKTSQVEHDPDDYEPPEDTVTEQLAEKNKAPEPDPNIDQVVPYFKDPSYPNPNFPGGSAYTNNNTQQSSLVKSF